MLEEFKKFVTRGNLVELAVAFIMCQERSFPASGGGAPMDPCKM